MLPQRAVEDGSGNVVSKVEHMDDTQPSQMGAVYEDAINRASTKWVGSHEAMLTEMQQRLFMKGEAERWMLPDGPACLEIPEDKRFCPRTE